MSKVLIPDYVNKVLETLNGSGYKAYIVGGAVRDLVLGKIPQDFDVATNAKAKEVKRIFDKTIDTGIKHGTVTVNMDGHFVEVTTFRKDGEYKDNRRPSEVYFVDDLLEDLKRRDFTINAMAYSPKEGFIDPFMGMEDLRNKKIRAVGNPKQRFGEDALRILRAVRFAASFKFKIEEKTFEAIKECARLLENISGERIKAELDKFLLSADLSGLYLLKDTNILKILIPKLDEGFNVSQNSPYHKYTVGDHIFKVVSGVKKDLTLKWAALFHDIGKVDTKTTTPDGVDHFKGHVEKSMEIAKAVMRRLRFDKKTEGGVLFLVKHHDDDILPDEFDVRRKMSAWGDCFLPLLELKKADLLGKSDDVIKRDFHIFDEIKKIYDEAIEKKYPIYIKDLAVDGNILLELGVKDREIGKYLNEALKYVLKYPEKNKKDALIEYLKAFWE